MSDITNSWSYDETRIQGISRLCMELSCYSISNTRDNHIQFQLMQEAKEASMFMLYIYVVPVCPVKSYSPS